MFFKIIVAVDLDFGISKNGTLPWRNTREGRDDMKWFVKNTINCIVIMGRNTWESIPVKYRPLCDRINIVITSTEINENSVIVAKNLDEALTYCTDKLPDKSIFVIGGAQLYETALLHPKCEEVLITNIPGRYQCDLKFPSDILQKYIVKHTCQIDNINIDFYIKKNTSETIYLQTLKDLINAPLRENRTSVKTHSLFSRDIRFPLYDKHRGSILPLLTTKKINIKAVLVELLWFLRGDTNTKYLHENNVHIWDGNSNREYLDKYGFNNFSEGEVGHIYGYQWRNWGGDQIQKLVDGIKTDPYSRRHLVSAWNCSELDLMVLPPCHFAFTMYVSESDGKKWISCKVHMRSGDWFLGIPFNIASYSLLTYMIGAVTSLTPKEIVLTVDDVHLYDPHVEQAIKQCSRIPKWFPKIKFNNLPTESVNDLNIDYFTKKFKLDDLIIEEYYPQDFISAKMVA